MSHNPEPIGLTVTHEGAFEYVTEAEIQVIESALGDLIQTILRKQVEEE